MTDDEMRLKIARACGWTETEETWTSPRGSRNARLVGIRTIPDSEILPDYPNDLNAMHEAEKILTASQKSIYCVELSHSIAEHQFRHHATARQRAIAFLKTIDVL